MLRTSNELVFWQTLSNISNDGKQISVGLVARFRLLEEGQQRKVSGKLCRAGGLEPLTENE